MNLSGAPKVDCPGFSELIEPDCGCGAGLDCVAFTSPPSLAGRGLFRDSFKAVVDEDGVAPGDCAASRDPIDCEGDEVPSFGSLFFDLDALFGSFARESCSC